MVAFAASLLITFVMIGIALLVARRRAPGTPLTWGEAFAAGVFIFVLMFVVYGVVPHQWLAWADNAMRWRSDKIGIPLGPIGKLFDVKDNVLFPKGIPLLHGHLIVTAQTVRDIIAAGIYIVALGANFYAWLWWQKRGTKKATPELERSAYGRPLLREG